MASFSLRKQDPVFYTGLAAIAISFAFFVCGELYRNSGSSLPLGGMFGLNIAVTGGYFLVLIFSGRLKKGRNGLFPFLLFLILLLTSAYSLNREIKLFDITTAWFCVILVLMCGNYIALGLFVRMPNRVRNALFALAGLSIGVLAFLGNYDRFDIKTVRIVSECNSEKIKSPGFGARGMGTGMSIPGNLLVFGSRRSYRYVPFNRSL